MKQIFLRESGAKDIQPDHPVAVFDSPGLVVEGWKLAQPFEAHTDRRVLRLRRGGQRLTTKGGKR